MKRTTIKRTTIKRTALKRPTLAQVRKWQHRPRKPIPRISKKHQSRMAIYHREIKKFIASHPRCAIFPNLKSTEVHHRRGRLGKNLLDQSTWMAVSQDGHDLIHNNTGWSYMMGHLINRDNKTFVSNSTNPAATNAFYEAHLAARKEQP